VVLTRATRLLTTVATSAGWLPDDPAPTARPEA